MPRPSKRLVPLLACVWLSSVVAIGVAVAAPDRASGPPVLAGPGCANDADCDGIPNAIEAAVGGAGIDPVAGTAVTSATQNTGGDIQIALAGAGLAGQATVDLPSGTTAGAEPITLEVGVDGSSSGAFVVVRKATVPAGRTKSMAMPMSGLAIVAVLDAPNATSAGLSDVPASSRFAVPPCPCPSSTSTNVLEQATAHTVTNLGNGSVRITGLLHSAVGMTNTASPVPATSAGAQAILALAAIVTGALAVRRRVHRPDPFRS